jgi:hypothetical protein
MKCDLLVSKFAFKWVNLLYRYAEENTAAVQRALSEREGDLSRTTRELGLAHRRILELEAALEEESAAGASAARQRDETTAARVLELETALEESAAAVSAARARDEERERVAARGDVSESAVSEAAVRISAAETAVDAATERAVALSRENTELRAEISARADKIFARAGEHGTLRGQLQGQIEHLNALLVQAQHVPASRISVEEARTPGMPYLTPVASASEAGAISPEDAASVFLTPLFGGNRRSTNISDDLSYSERTPHVDGAEEESRSQDEEEADGSLADASLADGSFADTSLADTSLEQVAGGGTTEEEMALGMEMMLGMLDEQQKELSTLRGELETAKQGSGQGSEEGGVISVPITVQGVADWRDESKVATRDAAVQADPAMEDLSAVEESKTGERQLQPDVPSETTKPDATELERDSLSDSLTGGRYDSVVKAAATRQSQLTHQATALIQDANSQLFAFQGSIRARTDQFERAAARAISVRAKLRTPLAAALTPRVASTVMDNDAAAMLEVLLSARDTSALSEDVLRGAQGHAATFSTRASIDGPDAELAAKLIGRLNRAGESDEAQMLTKQVDSLLSLQQHNVAAEGNALRGFTFGTIENMRDVSESTVTVAQTIGSGMAQRAAAAAAAVEPEMPSLLRGGSDAATEEVRFTTSKQSDGDVATLRRFAPKEEGGGGGGGEHFELELGATPGSWAREADAALELGVTPGAWEREAEAASSTASALKDAAFSDEVTAIARAHPVETSFAAAKINLQSRETRMDESCNPEVIAEVVAPISDSSATYADDLPTLPPTVPTQAEPLADRCVTEEKDTVVIGMSPVTGAASTTNVTSNDDDGTECVGGALVAPREDPASTTRVTETVDANTTSAARPLIVSEAGTQTSHIADSPCNDDSRSTAATEMISGKQMTNIEATRATTSVTSEATDEVSETKHNAGDVAPRTLYEAARENRDVIAAECEHLQRERERLTAEVGIIKYWLEGQRRELIPSEDDAVSVVPAVDATSMEAAATASSDAPPRDASAPDFHASVASAAAVDCEMIEAVAAETSKMESCEIIEAVAETSELEPMEETSTAATSPTLCDGTTIDVDESTAMVATKENNVEGSAACTPRRDDVYAEKVETHTFADVLNLNQRGSSQASQVSRPSLTMVTELSCAIDARPISEVTSSVVNPDAAIVVPERETQTKAATQCTVEKRTEAATQCTVDVDDVGGTTAELLASRARVMTLEARSGQLHEQCTEQRHRTERAVVGLYKLNSVYP